MSSQRGTIGGRGWVTTPSAETGIPEYDSLLDKHVAMYRPAGSRPESRQTSRSPSRQSRPSTSHSSKASKQRFFARSKLKAIEAHIEDRETLLQESTTVFLRSRSRLEALWDELRIPERDREQFAKQFFSPQSAANHAHISLQISRLLDHRAATLEVLKCIDVREAYLVQLRELCDMLDGAREGTVDASSVGAQIGQLVRQLRWISVEAVEAILSWRHGLTRSYPFLWRGSNYLLKMRNDLDWIVETEMLGLIQYATTANPLMLPRDTATGRAVRKVLAGMSELELQRMWAAERAILDEEGVQLRRIDQESMSESQYTPPTLRFISREEQAAREEARRAQEQLDAKQKQQEQTQQQQQHDLGSPLDSDSLATELDAADTGLGTPSIPAAVASPVTSPTGPNTELEKQLSLMSVSGDASPHDQLPRSGLGLSSVDTMTVSVMSESRPGSLATAPPPSARTVTNAPPSPVTTAKLVAADAVAVEADASAGAAPTTAAGPVAHAAAASAPVVPGAAEYEAVYDTEGFEESVVVDAAMHDDSVNMGSALPSPAPPPQQ